MLGYPGYPLPADLPAGLGFSHASSSQSGSPGVIITSSITIKLTSENYLFWKAQVGPVLGRNLLMGYVDGLLKEICPRGNNNIVIITSAVALANARAMPKYVQNL
jgi:hypothetical protein